MGKNTYGLSLWAYKESKSPEIFQAFADLANSDAQNEGHGEAELVALIDDRTSRDYSGRTETEQSALTESYAEMLASSGFGKILTYSTLPIGQTSSQIIDVMRNIPADRYYNSMLPQYKRDDPDTKLSEIFITARETDMLLYGANELGIGNFMFGKPAESFARWFRDCGLLKYQVRTILMEHIS